MEDQRTPVTLPKFQIVRYQGASVVKISKILLVDSVKLIVLGPFKYAPDIIMMGLLAPTIIAPLWWLTFPWGYPSRPPREVFYEWLGNQVDLAKAYVKKYFESVLKRAKE